MKFNFMFVTLILFASRAFAAGSAESIYNEKCALCHGPSGAGDGPVGKALKPPIASYESLFKSYKTKEELKAHIVNILKKGKPGTAMVAFDDKAIPEAQKKELADYLSGKYYKGK